MNTAIANPANVKEKENDWQPVLELATQEVFETMLGCQVKAGASSDCDLKGGFTAIVGLAGILCGVVTVRCSAETAGQIVRAMLGEDAPEDQAVDALGEMCNMIAGNFKSKFPGIYERCVLSVPSVISGGEYRFHSLVHGSPIETVVLFANSVVVVRVQLKS